MKELALVIFMVLLIGPLLFFAFKFGMIETPGKTRKRKQEELLKESEKFSHMPPEVQQLHIEAESKVNEAGFSFALWIITTVFSFSLIYWLLK